MAETPRPPAVDHRLAPSLLTPSSPQVEGRLPVYVGALGVKPETRIRDPLVAHLSDVGAVEQYITPPDAWLAVRDRWAEMVGTAFPCRDRLSQAVVTGHGDLAELRALALAETSATSEAEVELRRDVGAAVNGALADAWRPVAGKVYRTISAMFDDAEKRRDDARLDELLPVLLAAARLVGADPDVGGYASHMLGVVLTVDPRRAHLRRLVEAFPNWAQLRTNGAQIRANTDPLAQPWQLPATVKAFDADHILRDHDPLDGQLPPGWFLAGDGWSGDEPSLRL